MPLAALVAMHVVLACGSDGSDAPTASLAIETSDIDPEHVTLKAPKTMEAGEVEIVLRNRGDTLHDAQLFRVDGNRDSADVVHALEAPDPDPKPRWLHPAGGVAPTDPGETATVTQVLQPGTYYATDTQERQGDGLGGLVNAAKQGIARIEVRGKTSDTLPVAQATITAHEYGYDTDGIVAGANSITFRNAGKELHQVAAFPLGDGPDVAAAKRTVLARQRDTGWVPVDVPHQRATTVLEGGGEQITELTFAPGRYLLLCFVSDRVGGPPQWTIGMRSELDVPES